MKPYVSCCCCGCSLKAGTILIGILELLPTLVLFGIVMNGISQTNIDFDPTVFGRIVNSIREHDDGIIIANQILKIYVCIISISLMRVLLLISGTCQEKLWMLIPWIGTQMCYFIGLIPFLIYIFVEFGSIPEVCFGITIPVLVYSAISGYFFLVVLSHYEEIRDKQAKIELKYHEMSNPLHEDFSQSTVALA